jgi:hypothetical protein
VEFCGSRKAHRNKFRGFSLKVITRQIKLGSLHVLFTASSNEKAHHYSTWWLSWLHWKTMNVIQEAETASISVQITDFASDVSFHPPYSQHWLRVILTYTLETVLGWHMHG